MNIAWLYLDKRNAVINALKDYEGMRYITQRLFQERHCYNAFSSKEYAAGTYYYWL